MKYLPNHQYSITYTYFCTYKQAYVDISTSGIKCMQLGSSDANIHLGRTCCAAIECDNFAECNLINNARAATKLELLN